MAKIHKEKIKAKSIIVAALISIGIGVTLMYAATQTFNHSFTRYLWNAVYSMGIGLGLFANGIVFRFVEDRYISWIEKPARSIIIAIMVHLSYSSVIIIFFNWIYFVVILNNSSELFWENFKYTILAEYIVLLVITSIIYAKSFFKAYQKETIQSERLKQEAVLLQYQIMQNQVNPHFLFNSLNILGSLIDIDQEKAKQFTRELSLFYRELLHFKDKEIIPLQEEIKFLQKYIYLQKIRFGDNFNVDILIKDEVQGEVIPMSIQMLLENSVKHNIISKDKPLNVIIGKLEDDKIFIENNLQAKQNVDGKNNIGLKNLQERYEYLTNNKVEIDKTDHYFRVTLPLILLENE